MYVENQLLISDLVNHTDHHNPHTRACALPHQGTHLICSSNRTWTNKDFQRRVKAMLMLGVTSSICSDRPKAFKFTSPHQWSRSGQMRYALGLSVPSCNQSSCTAMWKVTQSQAYNTQMLVGHMVSRATQS